MRTFHLMAVWMVVAIGAIDPLHANAEEFVDLLGGAAAAYAPCDGADGDCCLTEGDIFQNYLPSLGGVQFYGWLDAGFVGNTASPASRFNGPYNAVDRSNEAMFNQGYLVSELRLPTDGGFGMGGRVDLLYGEDFLLGQSTGWELTDSGAPRWNAGEYYGLAMPQLYAQIGTQQLNLKLGHFYSPVGYEGVMSPYNFFYSKAYSYQFAGPFTHWGGLFTWNVNDQWQVLGGLTNGWNSLDRPSDYLGVLAGVKYTDAVRGWWTSFTMTTGNEFNNVAGQLPPAAEGYANRTRYSWLVSLPMGGWNYVFHHWLGLQDTGAVGGTTARWYGIDQYLYYTINCCWKAGLRFEWFRDEDGTRLGLNRPSNPNNPPLVGSAYSLSAGLNWTPTTNLIVRPELRWDWFDGTGVPYDDGAKTSQLLLAFDVIWRF